MFIVILHRTSKHSIDRSSIKQQQEQLLKAVNYTKVSETVISRVTWRMRHQTNKAPVELARVTCPRIIPDCINL
jgi:hypothetical protein